jgi:hypothetical protein
MTTDNVLGMLQAEFPEPALRRWEDVARLLAFTSQYNGHDWLFRGARSQAFALMPKIGRDERKKKDGVRIPYSFEDEKSVLKVFQLRARAHVSSIPASELEWMALAQHHGAPTRLLDWTEGLLIALWFAGETCEEYEKDDGERYARRLRDGALWCIWDVPAANAETIANPFWHRVSVAAYRPAHFDRRITAQQSVFTLQPSPTTAMEHHNLLKFSVAAKFKFEMRKRLDAAGVNKRVLFPDLAGLGEDLAWRYKNNWLAAYRRDEDGDA